MTQEEINNIQNEELNKNSITLKEEIQTFILNRIVNQNKLELFYLLPQEYFENSQGNVFREIKNFLSKYKKLPNSSELESVTKEKEIIQDIKNEEYLKDYSNEFIEVNLKEEICLIFNEQYSYILNDNTLNKNEKNKKCKEIQKKIESIQDFSFEKKEATELSAESFEDLISQLKEEVEEEYLSFETKAFNELVGGGLSLGTLGTIIAPSSAGKTSLMLTLLNEINKNNKVLFFSIEQTSREMQNAFISNCLELDYFSSRKKTNKDREYLINKVSQSTRKRKENKIINSKFYSQSFVSINDIENYLTKLKVKGNLPSVVFLDYLGIVRKADNNKSTSEQIGENTIKLRNIAKKFNIVLITAMQTNREGYEKEVEVTNISQSQEVVHHSDFVISLNRENSEGFQKIKNLKSRSEFTGKEINVRINRARRRFEIIENESQNEFVNIKKKNNRNQKRYIDFT